MKCLDCFGPISELTERAASEGHLLPRVLQSEDGRGTTYLFWIHLDQPAVEDWEDVYRWLLRVLKVDQTYVREHDEESAPLVAREQTFIEQVDVAQRQRINEVVE